MTDHDTFWTLLLASVTVGVMAYFFIRDGGNEASPPFALLLSTLASMLSLALHPQWRDVEGAFRFVPFRPHSAAFSIWALFIYPSSLLTAVAHVVWCLGDNWDCPSPRRAAVFYFFAAAWACTAIWPVVFGWRRYYSAAVSLFGSSAFATTALVELGAWSPGESEWVRWGLAMPCALLAGWTAVAFLIGVAIAIEDPDSGAGSEGKRLTPSSAPDSPVQANSTRRLEKTSSQTAVAGGAAALIASAVGMEATLLPDPVLPLVAAWAVVFLTHASVLQRAACCASLGVVCMLVLVRVYALI